MTIRKHANNFTTTLNGGISDSDTTLVLNSVVGVPSIGTGEEVRITIYSGSNYEIIILTEDASSPTFNSVTRGAEGSTAQAWVNGSSVMISDTANSYDRKQDQVATAGEEIDFGAADSFEIPNGASPTVDAAGELALDTSITDYSQGHLVYYDGTTAMQVIALAASDLTTPTDEYVISYDATTDKFTLVAQSGGGGGLADVVDDTTPQLGGNLDLNTFVIGTSGTNYHIGFSGGAPYIRGQSSTYQMDITNNGQRFNVGSSVYVDIKDTGFKVNALPADFSTASLLYIPFGTSPTVFTNGNIAIDTSVTDWSHGILQYYSGEKMGVVAMPDAQFTSPTDGYVVAYNATNDEFELVSPSGGSEGPAFIATRSSNQSVSSATYTKAQISTEVVDTDSNYDPTTNYRFTPTTAGKYQLNIVVTCATSTALASFEAHIYKNGASLAVCRSVNFSGTAGNIGFPLSIIDTANGSSDYYEVYLFQGSGAPLNFYDMYFSGAYLRS